VSVKTSSLVWESNLPAAKRYIALALADQANDEGYCIFRKGEDITQKMIAEKTGLNERSVRRLIKEMLDPETGVLEIVRPAYHHTPPEYRIRVDRVATLNRKLLARQGGQPVPPELKQGGQNCNEGGHRGHPYIRCLDVDSHRISLSDVEREMCVKELKRLFPSIQSIPAGIPMERAYLFWFRVRTGEIQRDRIFSPIAYLAKMQDEDISEILRKDRQTGLCDALCKRYAQGVK